MAKFLISLINQRFYSSIGVFEQERLVGNEFLLDLHVEYDAERFEKENLASSISYADLYEITKEYMGQEYLLLESVCLDIRNHILGSWPFIESGNIRIIKVSPPIAGMEGSCGVELRF